MFLSSQCFGQNYGLHFNYSEVHNGKNVQFLYRSNFDKHNFSAGIKYHINPKIEFYNNAVYVKKTASANSLIEKFGIVGIYYRKLGHARSLVVPSFFYNVQISRLSLRPVLYRPAGIPNIDGYEKDYLVFKPSTFVEQNIGIHLDLKMTDAFFLTLTGGGGVTIINNSDSKLLKSSIDELWILGTWEFSRLLSIGISYKINKK